MLLNVATLASALGLVYAWGQHFAFVDLDALIVDLHVGGLANDRTLLQVLLRRR